MGIKHGLHSAKTYNSWKSMKQRCDCPSVSNYHRYGGRGIAYCAEWSDFGAFLRDMGDCPPGLSLGRINNDGNYEPSNCRWETLDQQNNNRCTSRFVEAFGRRQTVAQWANEIGVSVDTLWRRLESGWPVERAVTEPTQKRLAAFGKSQTKAEWVAETGITRWAIEKRLDAGWSLEEALSTPMKPDRRREAQVA